MRAELSASGVDVGEVFEEAVSYNMGSSILTDWFCWPEGGGRGVPALARSPAADRPGPSDVSQEA